MTTIFFRTLIVYAILMGAIRLMGKRQIGELEISDLVSTLLISEIASLPIENPELPLAFAAVPILTILFLEVGSSFLLIKFPALRNLLSTRPTVLIRNGKPLIKELRQVRISLEELLSALRQKEVTDIREVDYAILEQNGQISVIRKRLYQPPDAKSLHFSPAENGITHILIADGRVNAYGVKNLPEGDVILDRALKQEHCRPRDVLLLLVDDSGKTQLLRKPPRSKRTTGGTT